MFTSEYCLYLRLSIERFVRILYTERNMITDGRKAMIEVRNVKKAYDNNIVLTDVNLTLKKGSIYGLIGKNGAGKTTLMNIMSGLIDCDAGQLFIDGKEVTEGDFLKVGYLPDLPSFFDYLKTDEYLDFLLKGENKNRRDELLRMVGLKEGIKIKTMSRGMRQRLGIAAALVNDPDILLLDEPTSALDPRGRNDVMKVLNLLKKRGKSIMLSTHILSDIEQNCDEIGFLSEGVIVKAASEDDDIPSTIRFVFKDSVEKFIAENPGCVKADYIKVEDNTITCVIDTPDKQKELFKLVSSIDIPIDNVRSLGKSLEDMFMEICK